MPNPPNKNISQITRHVGKIPFSTAIRFHFANNNFIWFQLLLTCCILVKKRMPEEPVTEALSSVSVVGMQKKSPLHHFLLEQKWSESKANLKISRFRKHSTEVLFHHFVCRCLCTKWFFNSPETTKLQALASKPRNLKTARVVESLLEPGLGLIVGHLPCHSQKVRENFIYSTP